MEDRKRRRHSKYMDILRFANRRARVDDGKSTLIGRLLFDSKTIFEDQLAAVESPPTDVRAAARRPQPRAATAGPGGGA